MHKVPAHIAVIMDGNGRWAVNKGVARIFGHKNAIDAVRETTERCSEIGIKYLTLYAFSIENWSRPKKEVNNLMQLLVFTIKSEIKTLMKNNVKLLAIGDLSLLPKNCQKELEFAINKTSLNTGLTLTLALSYSGRWEILQACKQIAKKVENGVLSVNDVDVDVFRNHLISSSIPDPELLIRTSGEMRISNFLLWQMAYTEIYVTKKLWPDFRKKDVDQAIEVYNKRERRFGKVVEK